MTGYAFQFTPDDLANVLAANFKDLNNPRSKSAHALAAELFEELDFDVDAIESAALHGDDMDEQTAYAYEEIATQLRAMGSLAPLQPSTEAVTPPGAPALSPAPTLTPREIEAAMSPRCDRPGEAERLYAARDAFVAKLQEAGLVTLKDVNDLDRLRRCVVANVCWPICTEDARQALLTDPHHQVRSCAKLSQQAAAQR